MQLFAANCFKSQIRTGAVYGGLLTSKKHGCEILPFGLGREWIFVCHLRNNSNITDLPLSRPST